MPQITLANSKGRDAQVMAESVRVPIRIRYVDAEGRQALSGRVLKGTIHRDLDALLAQAGSLDAVAQSIIAGDPELDIEASGSFLRDTSRVYVNSERQVVYGVVQNEIVRNPDGSEKLRRPKKVQASNVTPEQPLLWSGRLLKKRDVFNKFVIVGKQQIVHINGLTYDFLFGIARELEQKDSLLAVGAGPKSNQPLVLRRGALPYRGFLEGRTRGEEYCLLLHMSNIELKAPEVKIAVEGTPS